MKDVICVGRHDRRSYVGRVVSSLPIATAAPLLTLIFALVPLTPVVYADDIVATKEHRDDQTMTADEHEEAEAGGEHEKADWIGPAIAGTIIGASSITYEIFKRRAIREEESRDGTTGKEDKSHHEAA